MQASDVLGLRELIMGDDADNIEEQMVQNPNPGSVLKPSAIGGGDDKKQLAKPHAKIEIKQGEKNFSTNQAQFIEDQKKKINQDLLQGQKSATVPEEKPKKKEYTKNDIWVDDEVKDLPVLQNDSRKRPEIETMFKQRVGTEDVYFGMNNMDPTSTKCQELLVKVFMPNTRFKEVQLDINSTAMVVQSPDFYVHHIFPYPVKDKDGKAQWITDKCILQLTLPIVRDELY
ncbi:pre-RNA processing PIH1/Nop17 protein (macronuclear) [Tetrahymena thermophila SB210]|uniref:Pre-RNA processing PIH1/Nop17 protein n=1 Tax=Tetrahymena thermophila (strain SB210) TaxID=312017 RepID=Q23NK0_TETTS|nr:pre-RNA processing PIH1/Nop17 protein [Tetrahymena thermophila SB210]EAR98074.1 pre-RNA processing PIH1/Nop17 protein [Tetrahymena thermophila SB210]|eukprot:XP_001018319.1 pre-RNA processing PIH1/Nop17 protein [Tetrahymena thermophila SB210]